METIENADRAIEKPAPWKLAKDTSKAEELAQILFTLSRKSLRIIAILISPVIAESGTWNFRSTELEDGVERKRRTVFTRRCGVGEIAGWTCSSVTKTGGE